MKKNSAYLLIIFVVLYVILGVVVINGLTASMTQEYSAMLGTKALDIAKIAASNFSITDAEVSEMKSMTFEEALKNPVNKRFSDMFLYSDFSGDFKYAYIMIKLEPDEIKYSVTDDTAEYFGAQSGTPLDLLWLTDVIINENQQVTVDHTQGYYDDIHRYSIFPEEALSLYESRQSGYQLIVDEYGDSLTGFVPIYTVEGSYVGLLGTDIYYENFKAYTSEVQQALLLIFLLPSIALSVIYLILYVIKSKRSSVEANTDPMTSLYNRRFLETKLPRLVSEAYQNQTTLSAIMLDIDYFKNYNDHYGHNMGDEVIRQIASTLLSVLRGKHDFAFRYGGEEFFLLLPGTDAEAALLVAERISTAVGQLAIPHASNPGGAFITVSQGIYSAIPTGANEQNQSVFIVHADQALYTAKENGRNRCELYKPSAKI